MPDVRSHEGSETLRVFLNEQIGVLVALVPVVRESDQSRVKKLFPVFSSVIEDAISIDLLGSSSRTNQAYIIARALVERTINLCYLFLCTEPEYLDYIDYSLNKAGRRADRSVDVNGQVKVRIALNDGVVEFPEEVTKAIAKFTSERGREKTRWTNVSLPERAAAVEAKLQNSGLFVPLLTIYADASEALHGTLYGAIFHLGVYDFGSVPHDQKSLEEHHHQTLSLLYLMSGGLIDTLLKALAFAGVAPCALQSTASAARFRRVAKSCGLA